jgi:hypothetical protein
VLFNYKNKLEFNKKDKVCGFDLDPIGGVQELELSSF